MAEVTAKNLYGQLSPMGQMYYDQQFSKQYNPDRENILLSSQPEFEKMKAVFEAEQQVPEKGLFSSLNPFGSASAAEPDKINSVSNTPGFEIVTNTDGTIQVVPVSTTNQFPYKSMEELAAANAISNPFQRTTNVAPVPPESFNAQSMQSIFPTNVPTGIMTQAPLRNLGFNTSFGVANEPDVRQVDFLGTRPNRAQQGIAKLFEFLQRFSPVANVARGIESIRNRFDTNRAIRADVGRDTQGTIDRTPSPRIMNMQPSDRDRGMGQTSSRSAPSKSRSSGGYGGGRDRGRGDRF